MAQQENQTNVDHGGQEYKMIREEYTPSIMTSAEMLSKNCKILVSCENANLI